MASSSKASGVTASSDAKACIYDVFLSFRGEDTRYSFTDHLYDRLQREGIHPFRDDDEINRGEELKPEIERAIKESRGSIVVLSKNYATSTWCLDELVLILEQRRKCNHFVLPVFYGVEPTDVKNQRGSFAIEVKPSCSKWTDHKVNKWKAALMEVATLAGHVHSGYETRFLKEIVDTTYSKLDYKEVCLPLNIIGMNDHYKEIRSWLDQCDVQYLVIYGMGGSGKTTLAKYIYQLHKKSFDYVSFVEDIGSRCERSNSLLEIQEQLLKDILRGRERKIPCVSRGTSKIEEVLQMKRTLIVLDDIVEPNQLVGLLGTSEINAGNKIIITTRENTDNWFDFSYRKCQKYEMRLLNDDESSKLLCRHAFRSKIPNVGFQEVVQQAIRYCEGYPLALEVLGSSLFNNNTIQLWESQLRSFESDIHSRIRNVLLRSYESLESGTVKKLFLHIACFFNRIDMDYVAKKLEPDYSALSGIQTLVDKCLLSISPNKRLIMHKLVQEVGRDIVRQESILPSQRSRVWLSRDSYKILKKGKGSETIEGLALDMKRLSEENFAFKSSELTTKALKNMDQLKLLQLNFVEPHGSYENFSEDLRWLCWLGFHLRAIPSDLYMRNLVAIDMSYSKLEVFEPPTVIQSLKILNLKDSHHLLEIRNIFMIPNLETLISWNCYDLVDVCKTIRGLRSLSLLNLTGCKNLFNREQIDPLSASTSDGVVTNQHTFTFPVSLHRLFLKDCHLECTNSFPLSFTFQADLQYLNLGNSLFDSLPCYNHLEKLQVLDLSFCSRLKCLICLPSTLAELYIYGCEQLERITFQSHRFSLQEFGYLGCINLYEVEGYIKLVPIAKLEETELGHMKWLKGYKEHEVCLVGDDELTVDRSWHIQMLYEFGIMSTSLPYIDDPRVKPKYGSESSSVSFDVPTCPENKRLDGINITCKYAISGDDSAWFCKVSTSNGVVDFMYNPRVFGKPEVSEVCIWLSYWPIGNTLDVGETVHVSIVVVSGLEVHECGVSLVYSDVETLENNMQWEEILGRDLSAFELTTGAYYLCRRDFFELMEVNRSTPCWFRTLVGDTIDYAEVRGWRKTGRPKLVNPSFTELKTIRCIIHGPQLEDIYKITEMSKSTLGDKTVAFTSSLLEGEPVKEILGKPYKSGDETAGHLISSTDEITEEYDPYSQERITSSASGQSEKPSSSTSAHPCRLFSFEEIKSATNKFDDKLVLGEGGSGTVYKGIISSEEADRVVAIKRLNSMSNQGEVEFRAEINMLSKLRHPHLVSLIGYCDDNKEKILVYEYMPNGTLYHHLHKSNAPLSWITRLKIAIGVARGLDYLHTGVGTQHGVIHRNLTSSNILLDGNWTAMISDSGLSILGPTNPSNPYVKGTFRYLAPELFYSGKLTRKTDVYSFGAVLLELLTGRHANESLVMWAKKEERTFDEMLDSKMKGTISAPCLRKFIKIAYRCIHREPKERPTMTALVASLQSILELQEKSDRSVDESSSRVGFLQRIFKYFARD